MYMPVYFKDDTSLNRQEFIDLVAREEFHPQDIDFSRYEHIEQTSRRTRPDTWETMYTYHIEDVVEITLIKSYDGGGDRISTTCWYSVLDDAQEEVEKARMVCDLAGELD
jgi:hypothetical protein